MKQLFIISALSVGSFLFSQNLIPQNSPQGTIVTKTNQTIEFKNLLYEKGKIIYTNKYSDLEEFLYDNSVKSISYYDDNGNIQSYENQENASENIPENNTNQVQIVPQKTEISTKPKLTSDREIKNYLIQNQDDKYLKGKSLNNTGTVFLIGGGICFLGGGIYNLILAANQEDPVTHPNQKHGTSVPLIIGLVGMGAGVVMKIAGHSQMKKAIENYKTSGISKTMLNYYVLANNNGFGLQMKF